MIMGLVEFGQVEQVRTRITWARKNENRLYKNRANAW